ncbi:MAG: hypothetical protein ABR585_12830 [Gemmatimonadaceae bacterium]|nr:hypothetical protein [Actinomycetota bacterium]
MSFYKKGMRLLPHPDVPNVGGLVVEADDDMVYIIWDDGETDQWSQTNSEEPDLRVDNG